MAFSDISSDFSSLSLNDSEMNGPSFQHILRQKVLSGLASTHSMSLNLDCSEDETSDSDNEFFEKYSLEGSEKEDLTQATPKKLDLRDYQKELAVNALKGENTIICAPTGSGKTRVATYIIQEHLKQPDSSRKKVAFLARAVSLADQQYNYLSRYLPSYEIALVTGDSPYCMSLHMMIPIFDIIVMTPMILENHLRSKLVPHLGVFSLLVFDECHHTRKGEPYNTLMQSYHKTKHQVNLAAKGGEKLDISLPQIVGLTASIGIEGAEVLNVAMDNILRVCANLDALSMKTIEDNKNELARFVAVPTEESLLLSEREDNGSASVIIEIMQKLERHMEKYIEDVKYSKLQEIFKKLPANRKSQEYEQWTQVTMTMAKSVPIELSSKLEEKKNLRLIIIAAKYLKEYRFALETYDLVELEDVMEYLENSFEDLKMNEERITEENTFYKYFLELKKHVLSSDSEQNPNLRILAVTLMKYLIEKSQDSRCIVFVRTRALAVALSKWLNKCSIKELRGLEACSFTGANVPEQQGGTSPKKAESILELFRSGGIRLIVSTSVAEEGLDIPSCNLVIRYNHVGNEVTTVQSRGRTRAFGGVSILLAMKIVLDRERANQRRAELMKLAVEGIRKMTQPQFEEKVQNFQKEIVQAIILADRDEQAMKKKDVPFEIRCSLCRQVLVQSTKVRTIFGKYRISIDSDLFKKVKNYRVPATTMDEIFFLGPIKCQGELQVCELQGLPGKICQLQLGTMIKYKDIHYITLGITNIGFNINNTQELKHFKQWKKVPFHIEELSFEDTVRYLNDTRSLRKNPDTAADDEEDSDDDSDDNDDDVDDLEERIISVLGYRSGVHETEVKKPY